LQTALAIGVLALAVGPTARRAKAGDFNQWSKQTIVTVNEPLQVSSTVLQPGEYLFRLLDSDSDRHTVQIFNDNDGRVGHLINTVFSFAKQRDWEQRTSKSQFTFWETPPGTAKALRGWFYPGDTIGQEFPYPKNPYLLASAEPAPAPNPGVMPPTVAAPAPPVPAEPEPEVAPPAEVPAPVAAPPAEETPNPPAAVEPEPTPAPPAELPKTASPYPALGLSGLALLALGGLLRRRLAS
jgi:LPXTG-motif cell wall-anchored protein